MKDALVNIEYKHISRVDEDGSITDIPEGYEVVSISNVKAAEFEASAESLYLVDGELKNQDEMDEIISTERKESRFQSNVEFFKSRKIRKIKLARDTEYKSILVTSDGLHFKADLETIIDVKSIIEMLPDGGSYADYKCADGTYNTVTKEQFKTAITEGITRKGMVFAKEKALDDAIEAATSFAELDSIVW